MATGLFVGLITLDCIYRVDHVPSSNEKLVAQDSLLVAGGPATNAAVTFAALGNQAILVGSLGQHPLATLVSSELAEWGVDVVDLTPRLEVPPPLSTILVTAATGDRAVVSRNALGRQGVLSNDVEKLLQDIDIVLIDGHQMGAGMKVAQQARSQTIPVVIDAGSWKPGFDQVLSLATSVIAAAKFRLPGLATATATRQALANLGLAEVATTHGPEPIQYLSCSKPGTLAVPQVVVKDTLGAGDIFHGAFCHHRLQAPFSEALNQAAGAAAQSCRYFGPRTWLNH